MRYAAKNIWCGFLIGVCMLVPGVSGGSIAVMLGIYDDLLNAVSNLFADFKKNILFLLYVALGGSVGFVTMAKVVAYLIRIAQYKTTYFFLGIIAGGLLLLFRTTFSKENKINVVMMLLGFLLVVSMGLLPQNMICMEDGSVWVRFFLLVFAGLLLSAALILPGVSFSLMLVILGIYDRFIVAIEIMEWRFLLPLIFCIVFGTIVLSKALSYYLAAAPNSCHSMIVGFVLGSLLELFPGLPSGQNMAWCGMLLLIGMMLPNINSIFKKNKKRQSQ